MGRTSEAETSMTVQQLEVEAFPGKLFLGRNSFPREVVPGSWDPGSGRLHSLPGREV